MGTNTEFCFDMNGSEEFKYASNAGFYGTRCEDAEEFCPILPRVVLTFSEYLGTTCNICSHSCCEDLQCCGNSCTNGTSLTTCISKSESDKRFLRIQNWAGSYNVYTAKPDLDVSLIEINLNWFPYSLTCYPWLVNLKQEGTSKSGLTVWFLYDISEFTIQ